MESKVKKIIFFLVIIMQQVHSKTLIDSKSTAWMKKRISQDLSNYSKISKKMIDNSFNFKNNTWFVRLQIINNQIKIISITENANRIKGSRLDPVIKFLNQLIKEYKIPNVDFVIDIGDGFLGNSPNSNNFAPIFAFSKDKKLDKRIVLIPTAIYGNYYLINEIKNINKMYPFENKIDKLVWRGSTTGNLKINKDIEYFFSEINYMLFPRTKLVELSNKFPDLIDAKFSNLAQFIDENFKKKFYELNYVGNFLSIEEQLKYKYQILIDGNTAAWQRCFWQLFSNSLMFKHESENIEWYYENLNPFVHYIPIKESFSDLLNKLNWAKQNQNRVKQIIKNANKFAENNLNYNAIALYTSILLNEYAKLQNFTL